MVGSNLDLDRVCFTDTAIKKIKEYLKNKK